MTIEWSQFGLEPPQEHDRDRLVLLGGGRALVLGVSWNRSWRDGKLDDRFHVSWCQLKPDSLMPERGDIVLWRGYSPADPDNWARWGAPTRVLRVESHDDRIDVWTLEDADLTDLVDADEDDDRDRARSIVEHDRVLDESELWSELGQWRIKPRCPRCGGDVWPIVYGLPAGPPGRGVHLGGCVIDLTSPSPQCSRCGWADRTCRPSLF